jgi:hypothetical protein
VTKLKDQTVNDQIRFKFHQMDRAAIKCNQHQKSIKMTLNMTKLKQMDLVCIPLKLLLKRDPTYFISDMNFSYSASAPYVAFSAEETGGGNGGFVAQGMFPMLCEWSPVEPGTDAGGGGGGTAL